MYPQSRIISKMRRINKQDSPWYDVLIESPHSSLRHDLNIDSI